MFARGSQTKLWEGIKLFKLLVALFEIVAFDNVELHRQALLFQVLTDFEEHQRVENEQNLALDHCF